MTAPRRVKIAASVLAANMGDLAQEARRVEAAGADWLHLDVMDGHFVPNLTFGPPVVRAVTQACSLYADVHLMVSDPGAWITAFADAGAHGITVHAEAAVHLHRVIQQITGRGVDAGVSINPSTPVHALDEVLPWVQTVLVMSVDPGFGGQSYIAQTSRKIEALAQRRERLGLRFNIEVDGGIKPETIGQAVSAGADICVAGTTIFKAADYQQAIDALRAASIHPA